MTDYRTWSLRRLKNAAAQTSPEVVQSAAEYFAQGSTMLQESESDFMRTIATLQSAWRGTAAQAAITSAQNSYAKMEAARATSTNAHSTSTTYADSVEQNRASVNNIEDVDTSWGSAARSGWMGGLAGVGLAKYQQQQKYDANRDQAATIVQNMDADGQVQQYRMSAPGYPTGDAYYGKGKQDLPPVPSSSGGGGSVRNNYSGFTPYTGGTSGPSTVIMSGPAVHRSGTRNPSTHVSGPGTTTTSSAGPGGTVTVTPVSGPTAQNPPEGDPTGPQGAPGPVSVPTTPQGDPSTGGPTGGSLGGPGTSQIPTSGSPDGSMPGLGAPGAVLGGAGLLGGGMTGGRGLLGTRGGSGLIEGDGSLGRGSAPGDGPTERGGRGITGAPGEEEYAGRRGLVRGPGGFAGEPVAAEAGRGGYPVGGSGRRRNDDDEESPVPDYLIETDDVWGDGVSAAPPVIGE